MQYVVTTKTGGQHNYLQAADALTLLHALGINHIEKVECYRLPGPDGYTNLVENPPLIWSFGSVEAEQKLLEESRRQK